MGKKLAEYIQSKFNTGLNTEDSSIHMAMSDLRTATNVKYRTTGGVESFDAPLVEANPIRVNSILSTKILGGCIFQSKKYYMASNNTIARWVYKTTATKGITAFADGGSGMVHVTSMSHGLFNGDTVTISNTTHYNGTYVISNVDTDSYHITATWVHTETGTWVTTYFKEVTAQDYNPTALVECLVYGNKIWFLNGLETTIGAKACVLCFLDSSNVATGLSTAECGLPTGLTSICLHLQRIWVGYLNSMFGSIIEPTGALTDWDTSTVYDGSDTAGYFIIDNDTEDVIENMKVKFGALVLYRKNSIFLMEGRTVLQMYISKKTNAKCGTVAKRSIGQGGTVDYFYSNEGVKLFTGQTVKEGTTNVDTISTDTLDRKIKSLTNAITSKSSIVGYVFGDKYYMSDANNQIFIFDEVGGGFSEFVGWSAEIFLEENGKLYFAKGAYSYEFDADTAGSITSTIRTKDFNLDIPNFYKIFHKLMMAFATRGTASTFTISWHLDGQTSASGSVTVNVASSTVTWDMLNGHWDTDGLKWDSVSINFAKKKINALRSGNTIAFSIEATGINRFSLDSLDLIFEQIKKEV